MVAERDLEGPVVRILERDLGRRLARKSQDVEIVNTARGNVVGGQWRKPDIVMAVINRYLSRAAPELVLTGFELKLASNFDLTSVYQAFAYTRFLHHTYVVVHYPLDDGWAATLADVRGHALELGVGLIRLESIDGDGAYDLVLPSRKCEPQPHRVDQFIELQMPDYVSWVRQRMR